MSDNKGIVVGIDESVASAHALDWALEEAARTDQRLRVIHVWSPAVWAAGMPGYGFTIPALPTDFEPSAKHVLDEQVSKALSRRTSEVAMTLQTDLVEGDPARVLVEAGRKADLLVVGGRGHGQVTSTVLGSATNYVLHHATCPVMVVPSTVGPTEAVRRVVVGVDGSTPSRHALRWGLAAARRHGCPLVAVHAVATALPPGRGTIIGSPDLSSVVQEAARGLEDEVAALGDVDDVDISTHVVSGSPASALINACHSDDLLVIGSRGRGGFASLVLGSVATQVAHHAHRPVVVIRDKD